MLMFAAALRLLREGIGRLRGIEGPVPINAWAHAAALAPLLPRLTVFAGLELGAGLYVNSLPPEEGAAALRKSFLASSRCDFWRSRKLSSFDGSAEVQALVLRLLDQHDRLERVDVVDPLLVSLRRDLSFVRPVVELHLRDTAIWQTWPR